MKPDRLNAPEHSGEGTSGKRKSVEFSRCYDANRLNVALKIKASPEECAALAERLELEAVELLEGELSFRAGDHETTLLQGTFHAKVVQTCVVSLESVPAEISETIDLLFDDAARVEALMARISEDDPEFLDIPEPIVDGKVDLGEVLVQYLALSLDPYPRKEGVTFDGYEI